MDAWPTLRRGQENPEETSVGYNCGPETSSWSTGPPLPGSTGWGEPWGRLTLMRSFSFCHFSASSSISMILSCSCSFCSDSSVCREGAGVGGEVRGKRGKRTRESRSGPTQGANSSRVHHSALLPFIQQTLIRPSDMPGTTAVTEDPATRQTPSHCKLRALGLGSPAMSS